jgi:hypothetical protein
MKRVKKSQNKRLNISHNIELDVELVKKTFAPIVSVNLTMLDKLVKKARKCRFCKSEIRGPPPNMIPAFKDVCRQADCVDLMNKSCDKVLPCGHFCKGFKGEPECLGCLEPECIEQYNK